MATEKRLIYADSGKVAVEYLKRHLIVGDSDFLRGYVQGVETLADGIAKLPPVDAVEVVHGRWIEKQEAIPWCEDDVEVYTVCSVCESYSPGESNYCPNCGAKMDGDGNG